VLASASYTTDTPVTFTASGNVTCGTVDEWRVTGSVDAVIIEATASDGALTLSVIDAGGCLVPSVAGGDYGGARSDLDAPPLL